MPHNTISLLIAKVFPATINEYNDDVMKCPTTPEEWRVPYLTNSSIGGTSPIHVVHLMESTSTASVLQTVVPYLYY